jgi:hypothetical protein
VEAGATAIRTAKRVSVEVILRWLVMRCFPTLGFLHLTSATSLSLDVPYALASPPHPRIFECDSFSGRLD